ncbi:MAG: PLP-dependent aminotransferase family protein [Bryobacteraceae bacterium]
MAKKLLGSIVVTRNKSASLQSQLAMGLKRAIQSGTLAAGDQIPSTRELASELALSRNTVTAAYDQLVSEGYLESAPRSGIFVARSLAGYVLPPSARASPDPVPSPAARRSTGPLPFRPSQPDVRLFPLALWNRMRARALSRYGASLLHYQSNDSLSWPALARALAGYLQDSRGVRCQWDDVAVTTGSQQALYLLAHVLARPGRTVYVEDPGYPGAKAAFEQAGAAIVPLPVDQDGVVPPASIEPGSVIYTTPSRQFPTGASLPVARRMALIRVAHEAGGWIIEDDYDSEFRYGRGPLPSLHGLDPDGSVIYVGSMSKVLFPSLRIGYVVLPPRLREPFRELRAVVDDHGPVVDQAALAEFISSGSFHSHIRRCRKEYARRLDTFVTAAGRSRLPLDFAHTSGGMNLTGIFREPPPGGDVAASARLDEKGFSTPPLSRFAIAPVAPGLVFGFTAFDDAVIRGGLTRIASLLR